MAAIVLTVIAAAASLATSEPEYDISGSAGGRVILSPENPEVRIPFTVGATDEAAKLHEEPDIGGIRVGVSYDLAWTDADPIIIDRGLDAVVESPDRTWPFEDGQGKGGLGANVLVLRWPLEATTGQVVVDWVVTARMSLAAEPPEAARITVVAEPQETAPGRLLSGSDLPSIFRPLSTVAIQVTTSDSISGLVVNHPGRSDTKSELTLGWQGTWTGIPMQRSYVLDPPAACISGPCEFEFYLDWRRINYLSAYDIAAMPGEEHLVNLELREIDPIAITSLSPIVTGTLSSEAPSFSLPVAIDLPVALENAPTRLRLSIEVVELTGGVDEVSFRLGERGAFSRYRRPLDATVESDPLTLWAEAECDAQTCSTYGQLEVKAATSSEQRFEPVQLKFTVTAEFLFVVEPEDVGTPVIVVGDPS